MNKKQIENFINKNKVFVGFGNWDVLVTNVNKADYAAYITISEYAQQLEVKIPASFYLLNLRLQQNILLHELNHGRYQLRQFRVEEACKEVTEAEEEKFINDITSLSQNRIL
jgi:hypothetical protein